MPTMTTAQYLPLSFSIVDTKGKPVEPSAPPLWVSSDPTVVQVIDVVSTGTGQYSAKAKAVAPGDKVRVTVVVDADLGPGVRLVPGMMDDINVVRDTRGSMQRVQIVAGPPTDY